MYKIRENVALQSGRNGLTRFFILYYYYYFFIIIIINVNYIILLVT